MYIIIQKEEHHFCKMVAVSTTSRALSRVMCHRVRGSPIKKKRNCLVFAARLLESFGWKTQLLECRIFQLDISLKGPPFGPYPLVDTWRVDMVGPWQLKGERTGNVVFFG